MDPKLENIISSYKEDLTTWAEKLSDSPISLRERIDLARGFVIGFISGAGLEGKEIENAQFQFEIFCAKIRP